MPQPLSLTSMVRSSSTLIRTVNVVACACRAALLTASRTTASAWSANPLSTTDTGPMYCTVVRKPDPANCPTAASIR